MLDESKHVVFDGLMYLMILLTIIAFLIGNFHAVMVLEVDFYILQIYNLLGRKDKSWFGR